MIQWATHKNSVPSSISTFLKIFGNTLLRCPMYRQHFLTSTVFQNVEIPSTSCCLVVGFTSLRINSFSSCQRFSMGLASGDSGGGTPPVYTSTFVKLFSSARTMFRIIVLHEAVSSGWGELFLKKWYKCFLQNLTK